MSAPVGTLRPNPKRLIEDIEGLFNVLKEIRDIADDQEIDPADACSEIFAKADEVLWPG